MGEVIRFCLVGLVVGFIARFLVPGSDPMGLFGSMLLGLGGSFVGGMIPRLLGSSTSNQPFSPAGFGGSVLGAVVLVVASRILF